MDFKVTLGVWGAASREEAEQQVNEMLDAYDLHNFTDVEINWLGDNPAISTEEL